MNYDLVVERFRAHLREQHAKFNDKIGKRLEPDDYQYHCGQLHACANHLETLQDIIKKVNSGEEDGNATAAPG